MERPLHLLLIDGDPKDRLLAMREVVQAFPDIAVRCVGDNTGFDEALASDDFDVVVVDGHPLWATAGDLLCAVRSRNPRCPAILVTDPGTYSLASEAAPARFDDHVARNGDGSADLSSAMRRVLGLADAGETDRRYRAFFEHSPVGLYRLGPDGRFIDANLALAAILGCPDVATLLQRRLVEFCIGNGGFAELRTRIERAGGTLDHEVPGRRLDGGFIWLRNRIHLAGTGSDGEVCCEGAIEDVSASRRADESLRREKTLSEGLINSLPGVFYLFDHRARLIRWNRNLELISGRTATELVGMKPEDFVVADDRRVVEMGMAEVFERGAMQMEVRLASRDGAWAPYFLSGARILLDGNPCLIGTGVDISARLQFEEALRASEEQLRAIIDAEPECVSLMGSDGIVVEMNAAGLSIFGAENPEAVIGRSVYPVIAAEYRDAFRAFTERVLRGERGTLEFEIADLCGERRWLETHAVSIQRLVGGAHVLSVSRDITEKKRAHERLSYMAHYDLLTDLPNRALFNDRLQRAIIDADRRGRLVAVLLLDLDRFKTINDTLGHQAGDVLLRSVADRLTRAVRDGDTVARISGDEFSVVLADVGRVEDVPRVAQKLLDVFVAPFRVLDRDFYMTPSVGITLYPMDAPNIDSLLRNADVAMYRAKEKGRNNYQFYTAEMTARAFERLGLEHALRQALARGEFSLHFQPVVSAAGGDIAGFEALLRWNSPERGMVSPLQFVSIAEETGLIVPIGEWALRAACAQLARWHAAGFPALTLAVNVSARQFQQSDLVGVVRRALQSAGLQPKDLTLEITESVLMQEVDLTAQTLRELSQSGVGLSVDDFGTGYSSLSYVKRFPVDTLKIDRSFVRDIPGDADDVAIAAAIIAMAHTLGLGVVAEGVETAEQLFFLSAHGCDAFQGYLFSRPLTAEAATLLLGERLRFDVANGTPIHASDVDRPP
jgi:diguanylate cyclase (GGDEF)-like protein/PAS domain S-box-containing protein